MGLKEGSLSSLVESRRSFSAESVFSHILQALDHLASHGLIHRDVKPDNILFDTQPDDQHQFQLGDFGLCNQATCAATTVGTPLYMAPEMFQKGKQTHETDV
jgi:serine/threonine protein kinase